LPLGTVGGRAARSKCTSCDIQLRVVDLIPVVSFVLLRGRCYSCSERISWQYPVVELITALLFGLSGLAAVSLPEAIFFAACSGVMVFLFIYDLKHMLVLDVVTLPAIVIAFIANWFLGVDLIDMVLGSVIGGGFFAAQYLISRGRWVGGGDIRLGLLAGVILGWQHLLVALMLAYVGGSVIALGMLSTKKVTMKSQVPFAVFFVPAVLVSLFFGDKLLSWYLSFLL